MKRVKQLAVVWARKTRATVCPHMPSPIAVKLEGSKERGAKLLIVAGWSTTADKGWDAKRVDDNLLRLLAEWCEEHGRGWRLDALPEGEVPTSKEKKR